MNIKKIASLLLLSSSLLSNQYDASERNIDLHLIDHSELANPLRFENSNKDASELDLDTTENKVDKEIPDISEETIVEKDDKEEAVEETVQDLKLSSRIEQSEIEVDTLSKLKNALNTKEITKISIRPGIEIGLSVESIAKGIPVAIRDTPLVIDGQGSTVSLNGGGLHIPENMQVIVKNINFTGYDYLPSDKNGTPYFIKTAEANSTVTFTGKITGDAENHGVLYNGGEKATCILDGVDMNFITNPLNSKNQISSIIKTGNLICTNGSRITVTAPSFADYASFYGGNYLIEKGTVINYMSDTISASSSIINLTGAGSKVVIKDPGTIINGRIDPENKKTEYNKPFIRVADGALTIDNHATVDLKAIKGSFIGIDSTGEAEVNVTNNSTLSIYTESEHGIKFSGEGKTSFNVRDQSNLSIFSENGTNSAIKFEGGDKHFNVTGGSNITVKKTGIPNSKMEYNNVAILFNTERAKVPSSFKIQDEESNVSIIAKNGPAVLQQAINNQLNVEVGQGTYFVARGKSTVPNKPIFLSSGLDVHINEPYYFDFRNDNGILFQNKGIGKFNAVKTNLATWEKGENLNGNPSNNYPTMSFQLEGTYFEKVINRDEPQFEGLHNIARMTGNNQRAKVSGILPPTNADKSIYVHIEVPEGKGEDNRAAFDKEAHAIILVKDRDGKTIHRFAEDTMTLTQTIYGTKGAQTTHEEAGWIKVTLPNNEYLQEGQTIEVEKLWRGATKDSDDKAIVSIEADYAGEKQTVLDVQPPKLPVLENNLTLTKDSKTISGFGEAGAEVLLVINGSIHEKFGKVDAEGKFKISVDSLLEIDDEVQVLLRKPAKELPVDIKPITNSSEGNRNPTADFLYHDSEFEGAPVYKVREFVGALEFQDVPKTINFGEQERSSNNIEFWPEIDGNLTVKDNRIQKMKWSVTLSQESIDDENSPFSNTLKYVTDLETLNIGTDEIPIDSHLNEEDEETFEISSKWKKNQRGIKAVIPIQKQKHESSETILRWTLGNVPFEK